MRLFQHLNGYWYGEFPSTRPRVKGKRNCPVRISLRTKNQAIAKRKYRELEAEYHSRNLLLLTNRPPVVSLGDFREEYLEYRHKAQVSRHTLQTDIQAFRQFGKSFPDALNLNQINKREAELWILGLKVKPVSKNVWHRHLKAAFNKAIEWGYLKKNPFQFRQIRIHEEIPRYLTQEEVARLLEAEPDPAWWRLWQFQIMTGCRRSEALQLTAKDIDWQAGILVVRQTKSKRPKVIHIDPELLVLLRELPQVGKLWPWRPDTATHHFKRTARLAGLDNRLHDLRHTKATWEAMKGTDPWRLKVIMGHRDLKTTMRYVQLAPETIAEGKER